jgi:hypothetical protein
LAVHTGKAVDLSLAFFFLKIQVVEYQVVHPLLNPGNFPFLTPHKYYCSYYHEINADGAVPTLTP